MQAFQVALVVKNPPVNVGDIRLRVQSLGLEDPLEEGMATHSSILARRIQWTRILMGYSPQGRNESDTAKATEHIAN